MDDALNHYIRSLKDPAVPVSISDVERLLAEYPFFTLPAVTLMRREGRALPAQTQKEQMAAVALNAPDPVTLVRLTDPDSATWIDFYPPEKARRPDTSSAIDTFISTYGKESSSEEELLERLIFNPAPDYSAILAREEQENLPAAPAESDNSQDALIDSFILKARSGRLHDSKPAEQHGPKPAEHPENTSPAHDNESPLSRSVADLREIRPSGYGHPDSATGGSAEGEDVTARSERPQDHPVALNRPGDDTSLSESLAKIYIKRGRYDKAFEIIHNLSLNNPKKSVYFADQLRFLRKLLLISQATKSNQ